MIARDEISNEILRRRDMRDAFTFTIDPADAKDFDDAISFEIINEDEENLKSEITNLKYPVYRIGVHIADVSYYVRPNTPTDDDAYRRGTSVYLVDRVIPMLPEELCNDKCSLRPGEDKLCMSVVFTMDADARVLKYKICRTVIRSDVRLNYDEAQEMIKGERLEVKGERETLSTALLTLNDLAQQLRAERIANGALTIEQDEMRFRLDEHGHPTDIYFESPNEAHHLIEEFMLLANRTVAKAVGSGRPFVYRVHDLPNGEKLEEVKAFKRKMGNRVTQQTLDLLTIRAQAKAVYSTYNIGHYGLAFSHYTHFTSPIRRYPDLMVHRLVEKYILTGKPISLTREELEEKCEHCSACEQEAAQAERDSIKLFQAIWMNDHIGEILPGHISGVTEFGFFVQLDESRCEGLVHISNIGFPGETWQYDEKNYRLVCAENHLSYTLGDPVTVKVTKCDINRALIDFELAKNA
ncbi:MAG: RNB domain-containing ribonuclease [Paludibacteraceae bacterium]|nr:RNB domain-containing ribonuclease [Paludibacteraceae bacterium]